MSLRKSPCPTPRRLDAARRNAQRSTGPRTEAGKQRMKLNALKHGCEAAPENDAAVMRALGENPERYEAFKRELATAYGPGDALWDLQLADLARLYWRRNRIERMQTGLMRRALQAVEERQRERRQQIATATFDASSSLATDLKLSPPADPCARLRQLLSRLSAIRAKLGRGVLMPSLHSLTQKCYPGPKGGRPARLLDLAFTFGDRAFFLAEKDTQKLNKLVQEMGGEANLERLWQEMLRLLEEEMAAVQAAFEEEVKVQEEREAIERDACLAPEGRIWELLVRQEMALDRTIDRKVRILLAMRKEHAREARELSKLVGLDTAKGGADIEVDVCATPAGTTETPAEEDAAETSKSPEQSQNVLENEAPKGGADIEVDVCATLDGTTESPAEEDAAEASKSPEQSQNVLENKESAVAHTLPCMPAPGSADIESNVGATQASAILQAVEAQEVRA